VSNCPLGPIRRERTFRNGICPARLLCSQGGAMSDDSLKHFIRVSLLRPPRPIERRFPHILGVAKPRFNASPRRTLTFVRWNALLALCMLGVLSATCNLGLPTTVDCPWTIIGPGYGNIPGQIPVGKEVLLQVFRDAGAPGLPDNLGCKP